MFCRSFFFHHIIVCMTVEDVPEGRPSVEGFGFVPRVLGLEGACVLGFASAPQSPHASKHKEGEL